MAVENVKMRRYVSRKEVLSYALSVGGNSLVGGFSNTWGTYFFVNILKIDSGWLSSMFAVRGVWDTFNDPIMGTILDHTSTRFGKLRPYLVATPIPNAVLSVLLYFGPLFFVGASPKSVSKFLYIVVILFAQELIGTIGSVAYGAVVTAASPSPVDRQRFYTAGSFASFLLSGIPGIIISAIIDLNRNGVMHLATDKLFSYLGASSSFIGGMLFFIAVFNIKERVVRPSEQPKILLSFKYLMKNRPLICLVLKGVLGTFSSLGSTFGTYYYADVLGASSYRSLCGIPSFVIGTMAFSYIPFFKKRWNNKQIDIIVSIGRAIAPTIAFFLGLGHLTDVRYMLPIITAWNAFSAVFDGIGSVVPGEMMAETVDYMEWKCGVRSEGLNFAAANLITKLVSTFNSSLTMLIISKIGYRPGLGVRAQSKKTNIWLWAFFGIIPQLLGVVDCIPILFYNLTGETRERMFAELTERRKKILADASAAEAQAAVQLT